MLLFFITLGLLTSSVHSRCYGKSDNCANNPDPSHQSSPYNYHPETCNLKWSLNCADNGEQKPPAFFLCTKSSEARPSGLLATDWYTLALQKNPSDGSLLSLHGLWPGSKDGKRANNQPFGCKNGEEFDEKIFEKFTDLFNTYWPSDPKYGNTLKCFILSEWMKHGTCAVITGQDGNAFRLEQEMYYRTAIVLVNEMNLNDDLKKSLDDPRNSPTISIKCVECAFAAAIDWNSYDVDSVPRMPTDCLDQCSNCGTDCDPAQLDSTVEINTDNAPLRKAKGSAEISMNGEPVRMTM